MRRLGNTPARFDSRVLDLVVLMEIKTKAKHISVPFNTVCDNVCFHKYLGFEDYKTAQYASP